MRLFLILFSLVLIMPVYSQKTETLYLSGTGSDDTVLWDFFCTAGRNSGKWSKIHVPSNWEFEGFGQFNYGHDTNRLNESGLYRYEFKIPENWRNKTINIVFEGSMTDTEVKVNGKSAGDIHQGAFYRFKYNITDLLNIGDNNLLEVVVNKSSSNESVENAERRSDFWIHGGIYRPVWLESLPKTHIEQIGIDAKCDGTFNMDVSIEGRNWSGDIITQIKTLDGRHFGNPIYTKSNSIGTTRVSAIYDNPALWSSEFPNRYMVEVSLVEKGKHIHTITEKFGFRTVEFRKGDGFYVNGTKIKFKGVNRHSHWPTTGRSTNYSISLNDANIIKEMNMNSVRMSHYPPDKHFLEVCDSVGLYVINELTGWQSAYDTEVGKKLVRELVTRDVNHPCVVMWANGNEGGFNFDLLPEYSKYDIQKRFVFHPWLEEEYVNTYHYPAYGIGTNFLFNGNKVFYPTEFMHGLYDGGHGAGLDDFWNLMQANPLSAGGFLWDFADQGIVRDYSKKNEIDTDGNHAADGILGPYREKEGSFFTIREIWSPVYIEGPNFLSQSFDGNLRVENRYHFTNLNRCDFYAKWERFDFLSGKSTSIETKVMVPDIPPGLDGFLNMELPKDIADYDVLYLTAIDLYGKEIYTWTRTITKASDYAPRIVENSEGVVSKKESGDNILLSTENTSITIDKSKGVIREIEVNGENLSLAHGPRYTNEGMILSDVRSILEDGVEKVQFYFTHEESQRRSIRNIIQLALLPSGWLEIDYSFDVGGYYDHIGITFDYPEDMVKQVKWLGNGPYRVWKNRLKGVTFNLWEKEYNNTITGESWDYPEFKGFHSGFYAADIMTKEGVIRLVAASDDLFMHLFTPDKPTKRNNDNTLGVFPDGQLSILNAISPVGTKFKKSENLGPQSQQNYFLSSGHAEPLKGKIYLKFIP